MENKKSLIGRTTVTFICDECGKEGIKTKTEYERNLRLSRKNYCCRECSIKGAAKTRTGKHYQKSVAQIEHIRSISNNRKDDFTPFRYTLRAVKRRFKEVDIDLEYLKELWEKQEGICPYTGLRLILPHDNNVHDIDLPHRASLDRIDSLKGYVKGNVQYISTPINYMKSTMSDLETKRFLKEISSYTSSFKEDQTISSSQGEMSDAQAGN